MAHPFDDDYVIACSSCGVEAEECTLRSLYNWIDVNGNDKVSKSELGCVDSLLSSLFGEDFKLSSAQWRTLDEDGNGHVTFSEFARWAEPRLGLPVGVNRHRLASIPAYVGPVVGRPPCGDHEECRDRSRQHLADMTHPFDPDYLSSCMQRGVDARERTIRTLFSWIDANGSGKVCKVELEMVCVLLTALFEEEFRLSENAWKCLDEDGNGKVSFSEFAYWAGPRLGLPLGVDHIVDALRRRHGDGCGILGCPCESYEFRDRPSRRKHGEQLQLCKCGHKRAAHRDFQKLVSSAQGSSPYPGYWRCNHQDADSEFKNPVPLSPKVLALVQKMFDETYRSAFTRDRRKHNKDCCDVPRGYRVVSGMRNENSRQWRQYVLRRGQLMHERTENAGCGTVEYADVKSAVAWMAHGGANKSPLVNECNAWYLFHGTNKQASDSICDGGFKMSCAGSNTGTLYGRGTYLCESITKADEYTKPNSDGEHSVLVVRALGGNVKYTAELKPDPDELLDSCIEGPFDCVLGDREVCSGTYREFVFFDSQDLYPEYVIYYKRLF